MRDSVYLLWFRRVMWLGIVSNIIVALVSITQTPMALEFLKLPPAEPLVWPRFAAFLLILLSGFYVPAAIDPSGNIFASIFAVVCRFGGVVFFSIVGGATLYLGSSISFSDCRRRFYWAAPLLHPTRPENRSRR
ncbi:MAG: hypothetical protein WA624_20655 [Methylocella sp.]